MEGLSPYHLNLLPRGNSARGEYISWTSADSLPLRVAARDSRVEEKVYVLWAGRHSEAIQSQPARLGSLDYPKEGMENPTLSNPQDLLDRRDVIASRTREPRFEVQLHLTESRPPAI